ncbi:GGDEF domain-containing protein [Paracraurococcus lichenis]|uniref:GGDEF domain-containing protein n=1 Tax=Paracraurococcus lichenis TaxID=3064888 RepID=A0ABT9ECG6_9PROT|nr:GGDEF domain-containing protein [Paracraurococcus sp. LOR1-02]MDO9713904.1 GGDEF domain-containing protein [Paracraurococcus sp. LOR1-02]
MLTNLERAGQRDPLTGTATPTAMHRFVEVALDLSDSEGLPVALVAIGLDGLDRIATVEGPDQVDSILLGVADRLRAGLRSNDLVGRLPQGFAICLPEAFRSGARNAALRLQRLVAGTPVPTERGPIAIRCSIGLAFGRGPGSPAQDLIARACVALASAQASGGGQIVIDP